jgi:septum site-determining protein MinC
MQSSDVEVDQQCFQLKGSLLPMTVMEVLSYDYQAFNARLSKLVKQAPSFFKQMPIIINLEKLPASHDPIDFIELIQLCEAYGIQPVAIKGGNDDQKLAAMVAGLPRLPTQQHPKMKELNDNYAQKMKEASAKKTLKSSKENLANTPNEPPTVTEVVTDVMKERSVYAANTQGLRKEKDNTDGGAQKEPVSDTATHQTATDQTATQPIPPPAFVPAKIIRQPVRSGQQIYAKGGDLIILSSVSTGAEVLADGNIHIYGPLRGRALAGVLGNTEASIFCMRLEAELISIAGRYKVDEDVKRSFWQKSVRISLVGNQLQVDPLSI